MSSEYTSQSFMEDAINDLPDWPEEFEYNYYRWGSYWSGWWGWYSYRYYYDLPWKNWRLAKRDLSKSEEHFVLSRMQYTFHSCPTIPQTLEWHEIFVPEDDPDTEEDDESRNQRVVQSYTWTPPQGGGESQVYEIDPSQFDCGDGNYYMVFPPRLGGYNGGDYGHWLDPQEKQTAGLTVVPTPLYSESWEEQTGEVYQATFWLGTTGVSHARYTFTWEGEGITLVLTGIYDADGNWTEREIQNGETFTEEELRNSSLSFYIRVNPQEMTTAFAEIKIKTTDEAGTSLGEDSIKAKFLPELMVDGNRDGEMSFTDTEIRNADWTDSWRTYRFWCNDDSDGLPNKEDEVVPPPFPDYEDGVIQTARDLEDFARLWINVSGLQTGLSNHTFKIGLKWKILAGPLKPAIKIYKSTDASGSDSYVRDEEAAFNQVSGEDVETLGEVASGEGATALILPDDLWSGLTPDNLKSCLIFEGSSEGKGQLVVTLHDPQGKEIGEGPGVWLDIKNIKQMYQRMDSATAHPWGDVKFDPDPTEDTQNAVIFVHGWRMSPEGASNYAETMYKRFWHHGFKGRFVGFHWDTYWFNNWEWVNDLGGGFIAPALAHYNDSEYIAWHAATQLKAFVDDLPITNKNIFAHSMGNIVVGEALRQGMKAKNYALMNAAVPAACYDDNEQRIRQTTSYYHLGFRMWDSPTPDSDADLATKTMAYRGTFKDINRNATLINFYLPDDEATSFGWEVNNDQTKPPLYNDVNANATLCFNFEYDPNGQPGKKLWKFAIAASHPSYYIAYKPEAMAYACRTWGKAVGAFGETEGAISPGNRVDLSEARFGGSKGFDTKHSAQFGRRIQQLKPFYDQLLQSLDVDFNHR